MARQGLPVPTHQDETLPQRYAREHQDYLKLCGSMTAEQVADHQLQLNNSLAREQALQQRLTAADERADVLEQALKFYADRDHYSVDDGLNWDSCSGEPYNILWHEDQPWFIEDGSIAKAALKPAQPAQDERVCTGCGSKGWTANCKECVPY